MTLLDDETLASGDLSVFDTVVVGIRFKKRGPRLSPITTGCCNMSRRAAR